MRLGMILGLIVMLFGCQKPAENVLVIGTIAGPETELVEIAKQEAFKRHGLRIKIVEFSDYNLPNEALQDGSLDANIYQHEPYLRQSMQVHGYPFVVIGKSFIYPMALYSSQYKNLQDIPEHAVIALPNDPSNEARALNLLASRQLISLHPGPLADVSQIKDNPKHWVFKTMDAAQLPKVLPDVGGAVINTTFAIPSGLRPSRDALVVESQDSPYMNLIVIRADNSKKEQLHLFVDAFHSAAVEQKAKELFGDGAVPGW